MPYFNNKDINLLFIHIPKTGGTSIEEYFSSKFKIKLNCYSLFGFEGAYKNLNINSSYQHMTYNTINKYRKEFNINYNNVKIISIVRNPYERIISDLFFYLFININNTKEEVYNTIKKYLSIVPNYDNHNLPQYVFITDENKELIPNIHILRTENLTEDMKALGYTDFNNHNNRNPKKSINYYDYLNNDSIKLINDFYHLDFILFNYNKIIV